jgi:ADP-ribose pyrophosphatase
MIEPWRKVSSKRVGDFRVFTVRQDRKVSPRTGTEHDFFIIGSVNWVNVIALTPDDQVVLVEQYRHGSETVELEIPGGIMDASDASPEATGQRELIEETGYQGEQAQVIGQVFPNPAIMNNVCFVVFIRNCRFAKPVEFDQSEDLLTRLVPLEKVPELVASGQIRHALIVSALYQFELWRKKQK